MSFETISIQRSYPITNGYVVVPDALEKDRTTWPYKTALAFLGNNLKYLVTLGSSGGAVLAGTKHGMQQMIRLDEVVQSCCNNDHDATSLYLPARDN